MLGRKRAGKATDCSHRDGDSDVDDLDEKIKPENMNQPGVKEEYDLSDTNVPSSRFSCINLGTPSRRIVQISQLPTPGTKNSHKGAVKRKFFDFQDDEDSESDDVTIRGDSPIRPRTFSRHTRARVDYKMVTTGGEGDDENGEEGLGTSGRMQVILEDSDEDYDPNTDISHKCDEEREE